MSGHFTVQSWYPDGYSEMTFVKTLHDGNREKM